MSEAQAQPPAPPQHGMSGFTPYAAPPGALPTPAAYWAHPPAQLAQPKRGVFAKVCVVVLSIVAVLVVVGGAAFVVGRQKAIASPARSLVQEPCAQYRELSIRANGGTDPELARQIIEWIKTNVATFDQAAALDPELADAAGAMHALNAMFADPARMARTTGGEIDTMESPLKQACVWGPGRA